MIARVWSARAIPENLQSYKEHLAKNIFPELRSINGFVRGELLTRLVHEEVEITVTTVWTGFEAIEAFAHPDREAAVVTPEAAALLSDYDRRVQHYEIALTTAAS